MSLIRGLQAQPLAMMAATRASMPQVLFYLLGWRLPALSGSLSIAPSSAAGPLAFGCETDAETDSHCQVGCNDLSVDRRMRSQVREQLGQVAVAFNLLFSGIMVAMGEPVVESIASALTKRIGVLA